MINDPLSDKEWDDRLNPQNKKKFLGQLLFKNEIELSIKINYKIVANIELKNFIHFYISRLLSFYQKNYLKLKHHEVIIEIHDFLSWKNKTGINWSVEHKLPVSRYTQSGYLPLIELILPTNYQPVINININILRLIGSDLFGKLLFDQYVPLRPPFNNIIHPPKYQLSLKEQTILFRHFSINNPLWDQYFLKIGQKFANSETQKVNYGRKLFFNQELHEQPNDEYQKTVVNWFKTFNKKQLTADEVELKNLLRQINRDIIHISLFSITEKKKLSKFVTENAKAFAMLVDHKLTIFNANIATILSCLENIVELAQAIKEIKQIKYSTENIVLNQTQIIKILKATNQNLVKLGLANPVLIETKLLDSKQIKELQFLKFQLYIQYFNQDNKIPATKLIDYLIVQQRQNAFQKIYNLCHYLQLYFDSHQEKSWLISEVKKNLLWYLAIKENSENITLVVRYLLMQFSIEQKNELKIVRYNQFRKGFANFWGNAFLIEYCKISEVDQNLPKNFQPIYKHILASSLFNLKDTAHIITAVLLCAFSKLQKLTELNSILTPGNSIIDSLVLEIEVRANWNSEMVEHYANKLVANCNQS